MIRVRGLSTIGPAQVIVENSDGNNGLSPRWKETARLFISDQDLPQVVEELLLRCYQQELMTPRLWDICNCVNENERPKQYAP